MAPARSIRFSTATQAATGLTIARTREELASLVVIRVRTSEAQVGTTLIMRICGKSEDGREASQTDSVLSRFYLPPAEVKTR